VRLWVLMVLVSAGLLVAPETIAAGPVYGVQSCPTPRVRPTRIGFAYGDAGAVIHNIHWRRWGGPIAVGTGTYRAKVGGVRSSFPGLCPISDP
jgi:hypothetical protein